MSEVLSKPRGSAVCVTAAALLTAWLAAGHLPSSQGQEPQSTADRLAARMTFRTPVQDELLRELEQDFMDLLKQSKHADKLLDAEELLVQTNDNTHWTNYSAATRILRRHRDVAAIPLLLRYIVVHSNRSACHVMIPEYRKTISTISGHELEPLYKAGPSLESRMRAKVLDLVNHWWRKEKSRLAVDPARMKPGQLQVLARNLLEQVRYHGDFSGSGGKHDTAYGAYHNVYYKVTSQSSSGRHEITPLHPAMIPLILEPSGYRPNSTDNVAQSTGRFPYETIWILAEFVKTGDEAQVKTIGFDRRQNATVRMACLLALYRAGHQYYTRPMMSLLEEETDLERRLILLLSLRWAGAEAVPVLLENMNDPNIEVATAAGCALTDVKPREAIPLFEKLLDRHHTSAPLLLYNALAEYKSAEARALMQRLLSDAVEGRKNSQHLYRLLYAYADAWDIPRSAYATGKDRDYRRQARLALAYTKEMVERREAEKRLLTAAAASLRIRVNVAEAIQAMRRQEYKRLLALQGDDIVTAEETQEAFRLLQAVTAEVDTLRKALADRAAQLEAMEQR